MTDKKRPARTFDQGNFWPEAEVIHAAFQPLPVIAQTTVEENVASYSGAWQPASTLDIFAVAAHERRVRALRNNDCVKV